MRDFKDSPSAEEVRRLLSVLWRQHHSSGVALAQGCRNQPQTGSWVPFLYPFNVDQLPFSLTPSVYIFSLVRSRLTSWKYLEVSSGH